jgi:tetratricopeptide (TPR) repeat protein
MMPLATVLLSLALVPQAPESQAGAPAPTPPAAVQSEEVSAAATAAEPLLDAGLAAFKRRRFTAARSDFEQAVAADPQSAAAHFYLGYTCYKLGEPSRRMNANKEKAKDEFAKAFALDPTFQPVWGHK